MVCSGTQKGEVEMGMNEDVRAIKREWKEPSHDHRQESSSTNGHCLAK